jgi:hypothetical protein
MWKGIEMKVITYCSYILLAVCVLLVPKIYSTYLTDSDAYKSVKNKEKEYLQMRSLIQDTHNRASNTFSTLKNQRSSLKEQIQRATTTYQTNLATLNSQIQQRRNDLDSALNRLYSGAAMTDDDRKEADAIRKDTLDKADQLVNQDLKDLKSLALPNPIVD